MKPNFRRRSIPAAHSEPPFWQDAVIVVGLFFTWVSVYLNYLIFGSGDIQGIFSFSTTRFVIFPLLVYDFIKRPSSYQLIPAACILVGILGLSFAFPLLSRMTAPSQILPYGISGAIFLYFFRGRSLQRIIEILKLSALCAAVVPFMQFLGSLDIIPIIKGGEGAFKETSQDRVFSVTRTATVGVYSLYVVASLGGMLLLFKHMNYRFLDPMVRIFGGFGVILAVAGPIYAAQRASLIPVTAAFCFIIFALLAQRKRAALFAIPSLMIFAASFFYLFRAQFDNYVENAISRFETIALFDTYFLEGSAYFRLVELSILWNDLGTGVFPFAPGVMEFYLKMGNVAHTFLGQAFYDGGFLFLTIVPLVYVYAGFVVFKIWRSARDPMIRVVGMILAVICFGNMFISAFLPILQEPLVWMGFALLFVVHRNVRVRAGFQNYWHKKS